MNAASFSILMVCTGNICRSPVAERLMQKATDFDQALVITSAGTQAMVGHPIDPNMVALLAARGISSGGALGRQIDPSLIAKQDLILTATSAHKSVVAKLSPPSVSRLFTLREFALISISSALPESGRHAYLADKIRSARNWGASHRPIRDQSRPDELISMTHFVAARRPTGNRSMR